MSRTQATLDPESLEARVPEQTRRVPSRLHSSVVNVAMVLGAVLVAASAEVHLHLWMFGYRAFHIIGPLFLAQAISGFALALVIATTRRVLPAIVGALFLASTIGGLLISDWFGLFGFHDTFAAPYAGMSLFLEGAGIVVLLGAAAYRFGLHNSGLRRRRLRA
ncbi:MAG: hypothetical protein ACRDV4_07060 [Acidimicrobiales bacterium]